MLSENKGRFFDLKDYAAAFSFAVLWYVGVWETLFDSAFAYAQYFNSEQPQRYRAVAGLFNVLFLSFIIYGLVRLSSSGFNIWLRRLAQVVLLALALIAFRVLGGVFSSLSPSTLGLARIVLPLSVLSLCLAFSIKQKFSFDKIISNLKNLLLFLFPFSLIVCLQLFWMWFHAEPGYLSPRIVEKVIPAERNLSPPSRVVWIIFDELDQAALTASKENNTSLPSLSRLMEQSWVAENALPPNQNTKESIPALLTGKLLSAATPVSPSDINLYAVDGAGPVTLRESDNVISEVRKSGGEVGIVGWYHPYPRIFQEEISFGYWWSEKYPECSNMSLITCANEMTRNSLRNVPIITRFFPSFWDYQGYLRVSKQGLYENQIERTRSLNDKADELLLNPKFSFLLLHLPVPHKPYLGRRNLGGAETYFNSLEAMDDTIKRFRETLEASGQWDDTVFIVTSDHWWRQKTKEDFAFLPEEERQGKAEDLRIPFMVKFAGQKRRVDYEPSFNTIVTKELILSIFNGTVKTPQDFTSWLEKTRAARPEIVNFRPKLEPIDPDI